jgi:hypothetical protein
MAMSKLVSAGAKFSIEMKGSATACVGRLSRFATGRPIEMNRT